MCHTCKLGTCVGVGFELFLNDRIPCVRCLCLRSRLVTLNRKYPKNVYRNQAQGRSRVHQPVVPLPEKIPVMSPAFRNHWQHRPTPAATRNPEPIEPIPLGFDTNRIMWLCWVISSFWNTTFSCKVVSHLLRCKFEINSQARDRVRDIWPVAFEFWI